MKSRARGLRKLASLRKELERLRMGYARALARKIEPRGDLPCRILAIKAKIAKLLVDVGEMVEAA